MKTILLGGAAAIALSTIAAPAIAADQAAAGAAATAVVPDTILLKKWTGPYDGVPPWDQVSPTQFSQAFQVGIDEMLREIDAMLADSVSLSGNAARIAELGRERARKSDRLAKAEEEWLAASARREELSA